MKRLGFDRPKVVCEATKFSCELTWADEQQLGESLDSLNQEVFAGGNVERLRECLDVFPGERDLSMWFNWAANTDPQLQEAAWLQVLQSGSLQRETA